MLKKILIALGALVALVVLVAGCFVGYMLIRKPVVAFAPDVRVAMTVENIARGKYIFESVADCGGCHSQRDFTKVGGPVVPTGIGRGNVLSDIMKGLPGTVVAANITPDNDTGIGSWSDGEKIRAIREGVDKDGNALFPMMSYKAFARFSNEDVQALVAYLDSLAPVKNALPKTRLIFPVSLLIRNEPQPVGNVPLVDKSDPKKYGEYLVAVGGCGDCHTPVDDSKHQPILTKLLAGGQVFDTTFGKVLSANITPDMETGIGKWSQDFFLKKFYDYKDYATNGPPTMPGPENFTLMPWLVFSQRPADELAAIYTYLKSIPAVRNQVDTHPGFPNKPAVP